MDTAANRVGSHEPELILIVDDEPDQVETLSWFLEDHGFATIAAQSAKQALASVRERAVSVALLDVNLPDMDGTNLLQQIKEISPDIVCIMMTGDKTADIVVDALNIGAAGYFHKPFAPEDLLPSIREKIEKQRLIRENMRLVEILATTNRSLRATIRRLDRLHELSRTISSALDLDDVLSVARESVIDALGYDRCEIFLVDLPAREIRGHRGPAVDAGSPTVILPLEGDLPIQRIARGEIPSFVSRREDPDASAPFEEPGPFERDGNPPFQLMLPMMARDRIVGVLTVDNQISGQPISPDDIEQLTPFTAQTAIAIDNAALFRSSQEHLLSAREKTDELELLWRMAQAVAAEIGLEGVLEAVLEWSGRVMATETIALLLFGDRRHERIIRTSNDLAAERVYHALYGSGKGSVGREAPHNGVWMVNDISRCADDALRIFADDAGIRSLLCVPLRVGDEWIGLLAVFADRPDHYVEADTRRLTTLGSMAATAIHNARLHDREHRIADTLQREFLTDPPERIGSFRIEHFYQSALEEAKVGGDFYDVVELPDGRAAVLLADVSGKGLKAAVYTAMGKYMFRGLLVDDPSPGRLVQRLNTALCRYTETGVFITLFYGLLNPENGLLQYANAGHEAPLLAKSGADHAITLPGGGVVLGINPSIEYEEREIVLQKGDRLLLYTDGVTDARKASTGGMDARGEGIGAEGTAMRIDSIDDGLAMLGTDGLSSILIETVSEGATSLLTRLHRKLLTYSGGWLHDDIAMLSIEADS